MKLTISSLADTSSILYEGRAKISDLEDIGAMADEAWRKRLEDAIKESGRSKREVSLKAGKGAGYVHSILSEGKDPTIESLIAVAQVLNVSLTWIVYGFEMSPATEQLLSLIEQNPDDRAAVLQILQKREKA